MRLGREAGIEWPRRARRRWTDEDIIDRLRTVCADLDLDTISSHDWTIGGHNPSVGIIAKRYGRWAAALAAAGLSPVPNTRTLVATKARSWTDADLVARIRPDDTVASYEARRRTDGGPGVNTIIDRYRSWTAAKAAAATTKPDAGHTTH